MGIDLWTGILIGFALSVAFWFYTTKWLDARLRVPNRITEVEEADGRFTYVFSVENTGHRDAVDVRVKCTLFSRNWAGDPVDLVATIAIPVSFGQIDVMPGRSWTRKLVRRTRPIDRIGARLVSLRLEEISDFQKKKLARVDNELRGQLDDRRLRLSRLMALGSESFLSVVVYRYDRFSGARSITTNGAIQRDGIHPLLGPLPKQ